MVLGSREVVVRDGLKHRYYPQRVRWDTSSRVVPQTVIRVDSRHDLGQRIVQHPDHASTPPPHPFAISDRLSHAEDLGDSAGVHVPVSLLIWRRITTRKSIL